MNSDSDISDGKGIFHRIAKGEEGNPDPTEGKEEYRFDQFFGFVGFTKLPNNN